MSKARKRERTEYETKHEPSAGILPGKTIRKAANAGAMKETAAKLPARFERYQESITSGRWLDEIEAEIERQLPTITRDSPPHMQKRRTYLQGAFAELRQLRDAIARGDDAMTIARRGFDLAVELERAGVVMFETPAAKGREGMTYWRGDWRDVSPLERRILKAVGDDDRADLAAAYRAAWDNTYHPANRGKVDKAFATLNGKLGDVELHIRDGKIIID